MQATARWAVHLVDRVASIGVVPEDDDVARLQKGTLTLTAASVGILASAWTLAYLALGRPGAAAMPFSYQVMSLAGLVLLARTKRYDIFRASQIVLILVLPVLLQWILGGFVNGSAVLVWAFVAPLGALVFVGTRPAALVFAAFAGLTVLSGLLEPWLAARAAPMPEPVITLFFVLDVLGVSSVTFLVLVYFVRERQRALDRLDTAHRDLQVEQGKLRVERERSEGLLRDILPAAVAEQLKDGPRVVVAGYEAVTVLFVDVVDFTPLAARLPPGELLELLDAIFSALDGLAERHGLEKIKTIGDRYMAAAGLPEPMEAVAGATAAAGMALEIVGTVAAAAAGTVPLQVRVGLHTGPAVAGVIGRRKFAYDLWGDAVNVASRMESHGLPGRVQVSLATYELIHQAFELRYRGTIDIKGRGEMGTYLLLGRRAPGASVSTDPPGPA